MWSSSPAFPPLLLSQGGGGEGGRTPLGSLRGRDPATLRIQGGGGWVSASEGRGCRLRCRLLRTPFSLLGSRSLSVAVERGLALQAEGMRRGSCVLLATSWTVSSASYPTQPEGTRTRTHARTHAGASVCVCALTSRHTHGSQPPGVHTPHTQPHIPLGASLAPALGFSWALIWAPCAATKCEHPARAGEPAWARERSRGTHTFFRTPCPDLKLTITFGGRLGFFF